MGMPRIRSHANTEGLFFFFVFFRSWFPGSWLVYLRRAHAPQYLRYRQCGCLVRHLKKPVHRHVQLRDPLFFVPVSLGGVTGVGVRDGGGFDFPDSRCIGKVVDLRVGVKVEGP